MRNRKKPEAELQAGCRIPVDSERPDHSARDGKAKSADLGRGVVADERLVAIGLVRLGAGRQTKAITPSSPLSSRRRPS